MFNLNEWNSKFVQETQNTPSLVGKLKVMIWQGYNHVANHLLALERLELLTSVIQKCSLDYPFRFLATLVALHFTPVPHQLVGDKEIQTSIASRLASLLDYAITRQI